MATAPRYVGYIAQSLDGYIATPDGGVGWLDPFNAAPAECNCEDAGGYNAFLDEDGPYTPLTLQTSELV